MTGTPHTASRYQKIVFGEDVKIDPIGNFPIEQGSGALSVDEQRENFCKTLPQPEADEMRRRMSLPVPSDIAAAAKAKAAAEAAHKAAAAAALTNQPALEAKIADLQKQLAAETAAKQTLEAEIAKVNAAVATAPITTIN